MKIIFCLFFTLLIIVENDVLADSPVHILSNFDVLKDDHSEEHRQHEEKERQAFEQRILELKNAQLYSCELKSEFGQCREYPINTALKSKLTGLKESCESLPEGKFQHGPCNFELSIGACQNILLNHHDSNSLIYTNYYYSLGKRPWVKGEVKRVCADLEGALVIN